MDWNTILLMFGMVAGLFVYWRKGGNQASTEIIALYKARDEIQDKERKEMKNEIVRLTGEVGRLNGLLEDRDRRIGILESVDINRNPTLAEFMAKLTKTADDSATFMVAFKDLPAILVEINKSMQHINEHMAKHV